MKRTSKVYLFAPSKVLLEQPEEFGVDKMNLNCKCYIIITTLLVKPDTCDQNRLFWQIQNTRLNYNAKSKTSSKIKKIKKNVGPLSPLRSDKMKAVNILDLLKALLICKSIIFSTFCHLLIFGIFNPPSIFRPTFHTHNFSICFEGENTGRSENG